MMILLLLLAIVILLMWLQKMLLLLLIDAVVLMLMVVAGVLVLLLLRVALHMIAVHDPRVVGVWNFQSSALLIIGIYPSRYHENKFPSIRSTGKIKQKRRSAASSSSMTFLRRLLLLLLLLASLYFDLPHRDLFSLTLLLTCCSSSRLRPIYLTPSLSSTRASSSSLLFSFLFLTHDRAIVTRNHAHTLASVSCANCKFLYFYSPLSLSLSYVFVVRNVLKTP